MTVSVFMHKAWSMKTWVAKIGLKEIEWPTQSLDLNPMEHFWDKLDQ